MNAIVRFHSGTPAADALWTRTNADVDAAKEICLRLTVLEVVRGDQWNDTCSSEVRPYFWQAG